MGGTLILCRFLSLASAILGLNLALAQSSGFNTPVNPITIAHHGMP